MTSKAPGSGTTATTLISGITYQPFGPANALTYANGIAQSAIFDTDYRLTNLAATGASPVQKLSYAYDAADSVLSITDGVTSSNTQNLGYDTLNRLSTATGGYASLGYSYDANGNRLTENPTSAAAPSLDGLGNVSALTYNQSGRLATVSAGIHQLTQYSYDAFGHRTVKVGSVTATTLYQYDPAGHLLEENDGAGTSRVDYIYLGDQPIATIQPSTNKIYFLHDDRLGTPQLATDASQTVQWTANYQPFGYTNTGIGNIVQNLRLPGQELDIEPGFYQNGFRDYVPGLGRYLESDPIGLAAARNTYGYAALNPLVNTDPNGLLVVHIWNYLGSIGPNRAFGHASITLDDDTYISWWPSNSRSPLIPGTPLYSAPPFLEGYEKDVLWEKGGPNANIRISGLDEAAIEKWWNEFKGNHQWSTLSQNCSTTAVQALAAGGADFYSVLGGGVPSFYNLVWTPSDVSSYANSVNTGISNWNWLKTISQ
jgi:RHS repeat-associated protein